MTATVHADPLYRRFDGPDAITALVAGSDTDVLTRLANKPALLHLPGTVEAPARLISVLLHGNEDSGFRALCAWLRDKPLVRRPLWLFIGNVRAATQHGWFGHRYLEDQEDFNRVWGIRPDTTRMRLCATDVLATVTARPLEAAVDIHNNTGHNPRYAILPRPDAATMGLAASLADIGLVWGTQQHTLMQALEPVCPAVAVECGLAGVPAHTEMAREVIEAFVAAESFEPTARPRRMLQVRYRVEVRHEVAFDFVPRLGESLDLAIRPGLDAENFGHLPPGTVLGHTVPGGDIPLLVTDEVGNDVTGALIAVDGDGELSLTRDVIPAMMTRTAEQTRRDCLFYVLDDYP